VCCNEFDGYQGTANGSCICQGSGGLAIDVDSEFDCLEWPVLRRPTVVLYVLIEPLPSSCSVLSVSGSYSPSLLSGLSSERRTWVVLTSLFGHSFAMCPLSPQ